MSRRRSQSPPAFEVRCERCDVSFPVETKTCIHCGGPTVPADAPPGFTTSMGPGHFDVDAGVSESDPWAEDDGSVLGREAARRPIELADFEREAGPFDLDLDLDRNSDPEVEREREAPSAMRSILGSLGGLIWVVLFVLFSLARSCGESPS